jgi:DNA-binding NtrC family response regulator
MIVAKGPLITPDHLPAQLLNPSPAQPEQGAAAPTAPDLSLEAAERDQIRRALEVASGRRVAAARLLGLSRRTLYRKLDKYGLH